MSASLSNRRKWLLGISLACLILLLLLALLYPFAKTWRARDLAEAAATHAQSEATRVKAWNQAKAAYQLAPEDLQVVRTLAKMYQDTAPDRAIRYWQEAVAISTGAREDLLALTDSALAASQMNLAEETLAQLRQAYPDSVQGALLQARWLAAQGQVQAAIDTLQPWLQAEETQGADSRLHLYYVQLTQAASDPETVDRGQAYLLDLSKRQDALGLQALRNLKPLADGDPELRRDVIARLRDHPEASLEDKTLALSLRLKDVGASRAQVAQEAAEVFGTDDPQRLLQLGRWLNQHGLGAWFFNYLDEAEALARKDLFLVYVDALALADRWVDIERLLQDGRLPIEQAYIHLYRMRTHLRNQDEKRARIEWNRAILAAANQPDQLKNLADYAQRLGQVDFALQAYREMETYPAFMRQAYRQQLKLLQLRGKTADLLATYQRMQTQLPYESDVVSDLHYLSYLSDQQSESALTELEQLTQREPHILAYRMTLAFAYLKEGQPRAALALLTDTPVDWPSLQERWRLIAALTLAANGHRAEAQSLAPDPGSRILLPQERELLSRL